MPLSISHGRPPITYEPRSYKICLQGLGQQLSTSPVIIMQDNSFNGDCSALFVRTVFLTQSTLRWNATSTSLRMSTTTVHFMYSKTIQEVRTTATLPKPYPSVQYQQFNELKRMEKPENQQLRQLQDRLGTLDRLEIWSGRLLSPDIHQWELLSQAIQGAWRQLTHIFPSLLML